METGETLWLIGMMGAGKSTVGKEVSARVGTPFVDTDDLVTKTSGLSIAEFWQRRGEEAFRTAEAQVIERLAGTRTVVAAGGGAVMRPTNVTNMRQSGLVIWLTASAEVLAGRVGAGEGRPLLAGGEIEETLSALMRVRNHAYESAADQIVETNEMTVGEVAEEVIRLWNPS